MTAPFIDVDERLDTIPGTDFSLIQKIDGTAFSIDTLLLANFVQFTPEMLNAAGFAVVMGNGEECVKPLADYLAPSVYEDGIIKALNELYGI